MKTLHRAIIIFAALAATCLILVGCVSKKKATNRYKKETQYEYENRSSETVQNDLVKDSVSTRKTQTDWSEIINSLDVYPIDGNKPAEVEIGENENGNLIIKTKNANVSQKTQQEQKKEITQDSTGTKEVDKGKKELDKYQTGAGQRLDKGRTSDSEASRWPTWVYGIIFIGALIVYFKRATIWGKFKSVFK